MDTFFVRKQLIIGGLLLATISFSLTLIRMIAH